MRTLHLAFKSVGEKYRLRLIPMPGIINHSKTFNISKWCYRGMKRAYTSLNIGI